MHFVPFPERSERPMPARLDMSRANTEQIDYDQWTVASAFDPDRPLTRVVLNDEAGTYLYMSSKSGRMVLATTRSERALNYVGSIPHWLYVTELRRHHRVWSELMWWLSLLATIGTMLGVFVGVARLRSGPVRGGLRRWHHISGLVISPVVLAWIFSGFLSMDDGWLVPGSDSLFRTLHTLDFNPLASHPALRAATIVGLCTCGFAFSLSGAGLAWRLLCNRGHQQ